MRKIFAAIIIAVFLAGGIAFASVNVLSDGTNLGPAQDINYVGGIVSGTGPVKTVDLSSITGDVSITGKITATSVEVDGGVVIDGTLYTATLTVDGAIYPGRSTIDPCATLGAGWIFINATSGEPCYCDNAKADIKMEDGSTACF
jgi:hypothetical protein